MSEGGHGRWVWLEPTWQLFCFAPLLEPGFCRGVFFSRLLPDLLRFIRGRGRPCYTCFANAGASQHQSGIESGIGSNPEAFSRHMVSNSVDMKERSWSQD